MKKILKKIIICMIFTKILYSMDADEHWINTKRINYFLKNNLIHTTIVYFNATAKKEGKKTIFQSQ